MDTYSYDKFFIYKHAQDVLPKKEMESLEKGVFAVFAEFVNLSQPQEIPIITTAYKIDNILLYKNLSVAIVEKSGRSNVEDFFKELFRNWEINQKLQLSQFKINSYFDSRYVEIIAINYKDKNLIDNFVQKFPELFEIMSKYISIENPAKNVFSENQAVMEKFVDHVVLNFSLNEKPEPLKIKSKI